MKHIRSREAECSRALLTPSKQRLRFLFWVVWAEEQERCRKRADERQTLRGRGAGASSSASQERISAGEKIDTVLRNLGTEEPYLS